MQHLSRRSRQWRMGIAGGFVERDGRHLYDALALCLPGGSVHIYRKRHLVFWEPFRFRPGRSPLVVPTPWGAIGLAICADMIRRPVWNDYRGRIDLAVIAAAWPDFACRHGNRRHWLFGGLGPLSAQIPATVARDLAVPVIFANQCGATRTTIPLLGLRAGSGDRRPVRRPEQYLRRAELPPGHRRGRTTTRPVRRRAFQSPRSPLMAFYVAVGPRGYLFRVGMILTGVMGPLSYWWASRRRPVAPTPWSWPKAFADKLAPVDWAEVQADQSLVDVAPAGC